MRILAITNMYPLKDYTYYGIHVKEQIESLQNLQNVEVEVFFIKGRESKFKYLTSIYEIRKKIVTRNYDLIHVHYGLSGLFLLFTKLNIPCVLTLHSGEIYKKKGHLNHLLQKSLTFRIAKHVDKLIVLNDDMISLLNKYSDKIEKLPCGIDIEFFKPNYSIEKRSKHIIGFPGNKSRPEKNYKLYSEILISLEDEFEIETIEFNGLSRKEVVENLNKIDVLLLTSTAEGSPQIIKEAMACNKPIVSTNVGDISDLLQSVRNCFVIESFDKKDFLLPLKMILSKTKYERVSDGREKLIEMQLDNKSVSNRLYSLYQSLR